MDREVSIIPQRRTHQEIIDVDELDDEQDQRPSRRSRLAVPEDDTLTEIIILDNDEGSESGPSTRPRHPGARLRSPPPPVQFIHPPPPVPPIPSRPRPRRPPHIFPQDIIRPNEEPFPFERSFSTRPTSHPPRDVTPSRHHPVINLGGGFFPLNHQRESELLQRQQAQDQARQRYFDRLRIARGIHQRHGFLSQTIGRIFPTWLFGDPTEDEIMDALSFSELAATEPGPFELGDDRAPFRRVPSEYRVAYTHPYPPAPGFTHDFESPSPSVTVIDVDEEPGPSTKAIGSSSPTKNNENLNTLVCARCLEPLVLGGSNMSEDERFRRRLWGLRCGHMLDGRCVAELMKPQCVSDPELIGIDVTGIESPSFKSRGQDATPSIESPPLGSAEPLDATSPLQTTNARENLHTTKRPPQSSQSTEPTSEQAMNSSIRSRLRPRNNTGHVTHVASSSSTPSHSSLHPSSPRTSAPAAPATTIGNTMYQSKRRSKGKGKQKVKEPLVLGRHEWRCPVTLCERLHLSLHVESQGWVMDETQGAIAIFA